MPSHPGCEVHDDARAACDHARYDGTRDVEQPVDVDAKNLAPVALAHVEQLAAAQDAGVVDENVDASELRGERRDRRFDFVLEATLPAAIRTMPPFLAMAAAVAPAAAASRSKMPR
jgi:hypothetical protein